MNKNNPNEVVLEIKNLFKKFENKIILNDLNIKILSLEEFKKKFSL